MLSNFVFKYFYTRCKQQHCAAHNPYRRINCEQRCRAFGAQDNTGTVSDEVSNNNDVWNVVESAYTCGGRH